MAFFRILILFVLVSFSVLLDVRACTTAVISGRVTADGRPIFVEEPGYVLSAQ